MKLVLAIVSNDDASAVTSALTRIRSSSNFPLRKALIVFMEFADCVIVSTTFN